MSMQLVFNKIQSSVDIKNKYFIAYLEGNMSLYLDNKLYFCESQVLLLEFAVYVYKWLNDLNKGIIQEFVYESIDHHVPIITITFSDKYQGHISSIWQEFEAEKVDIGEIKLCFEEYLKHINEALESEYKVKLSRFLT